MRNKSSFEIDFFMLIFWGITIAVSLGIASLTSLHYRIRFILIILTIAILFICTIINLVVARKDCYYICKKCGNEHFGPASKFSFLPKLVKYRYLRCRKCNKKTWHKKFYF